MVEVQSDEVDIFNFFSDRCYRMFSDKGISLSSASDLNGNVFALHKVVHARVINSVLKRASQSVWSE
jgi:hypothetical protein